MTIDITEPKLSSESATQKVEHSAEAEAVHNVREQAVLRAKLDDALNFLDTEEMVGEHDSNLRANLIALRQVVDAGLPGTRVPTNVRSMVNASIVIAKSGKTQDEKEREAEEQRHFIEALVEETAHDRVVHHAAMVQTFRFLAHSRKMDIDEFAGQSLHRAHFSPQQERELFIGTGHDRHLRKIHGNGYDRSIVSGVGALFGSAAERAADETIATVETGVTSAGEGLYGMRTGDIQATDKAAEKTARGVRNVIRDLGIDDAAAWTTNTLGLNYLAKATGADKYVGGTVSQNVGHLAHNALWLGGRVGAAPVQLAKEGAAAVAGAATGIYHYFVGEPPKGAQPQASLKPPTVSLAGHTVTIAQAAALLHKHHAVMVDGDGDGKVTDSIADIRASAAKWDRDHGHNPIAQGRAAADTNHDGKINKAELDAAIIKAGKTFAQADTNHDGKISNGELAALSAPTVGHKPQHPAPAKGH